MNQKKVNTCWFVYIVQCSDQSFYTGITNNLERRLSAHNDNSRSSKAAKYTRARQPVTLVYTEKSVDRSTASQREYAIKQLTRQQKIILIKSATLEK